MSEPPTQYDMVREMSDNEITQTFDRLAECWEASEEARYNLQNFRQSHQEPERPENPIEGLGNLIDYNRKKWQYEQEEERLDRLHAEATAQFEAWAQFVRHLLPDGGILKHTYGGSHPGLRGVEYTVRHVSDEHPALRGVEYTVGHVSGERGQPADIRVEKRGHPPTT